MKLMCKDYISYNFATQQGIFIIFALYELFIEKYGN